MKITIPSWLKDTADRAWRTFVASFLGAASYTSGMKIEDVQWLASADIALTATIFTLLLATVAAKLPIGTPGTVSLVQLDTTGAK